MLRTFLILSAITILVTISARAYSADLILTNARVYSFAWPEPESDGTPNVQAPVKDGVWKPDASAVAIKNDLIQLVGSDKEARALATEQTRTVDLEGAVVLPGLVDSHVHIAELGQILSQTNLIDLPSPREVVARLREQHSEISEGEWIIGQGWDEGAWANNYPSKELLDAAFPNNPVYLKSLHGFAVWVNSAALDAAGITKRTKPPVGGEIIRDDKGEASGILLNRATTLMQHAVPEPSAEQFADWVKLGLQQMARDGYVTVHEAGAETKHMKAFESLRKSNELPIRIYAMLSARDETLSEAWIKRGPHIDAEGMLDVRSVKAYYDGALGSRGARLLEDYSDQPGHRGVSGDGYGFDADLVERLIKAGFQVGVHAIGDAGNRETLDFLDSVYEDSPDTQQQRHRIEHAQVIHPLDIARFNQLDVIASMEPPHAVEDKTWAEDRLGGERIKGAYAWRSLREAEVDITFNSDLPGSDHSIFYGLHAAVTRRDKSVQPPDGWQVQEVVTMEEALRAYTSWAAYSAFRELQTGALKEGMWADITVMDIDPFELAHSNPAAILDGEILMTVVGGDVVYQAEQD